jgi:hypothetical protein
MINLKQKDSVADAVKEIMQQEEKHLSPKQKKIAKMAGDPEKIDAADLAALRAGKKPVKEENVGESSNPFSPNYKSQIPSKPGEKAGFDSKKISTGTVYSKKHKPEPAEKETKEEFSYFKGKLIESLFEEEILDEMINEVLSKDASAGDWIHDFVHSDNPKFKGKSKAKRKEMALAAYYAKQRNEEVEQIDEGKMDQMTLTHLWHRHAHHSYGADQGYGGGEHGHHSKHAATAIENHVRKHYGNKVADDMCQHSDCHVAHAEYVGGKEAKEVEDEAAKLRKKHGIKGDLYGHHDHIKESTEQLDELKKSTVKSYIQKKMDKTHSSPASGKEKVKKDMDSLQRGHERVVGNKPTSEEVEQIDEKNWIAGAIKKPGAETAAAKRAGMSVQAYAHKHAHDPGKAGKRARLALTLKKMKENVEQIEESKRPEDDTVPFVTDDSKPLAMAKDTATKSLKRMKNEMMGKTGTSE